MLGTTGHHEPDVPNISKMLRIGDIFFAGHLYAIDRVLLFVGVRQHLLEPVGQGVWSSLRKKRKHMV